MKQNPCNLSDREVKAVNESMKELKEENPKGIEVGAFIDRMKEKLEETKDRP